MKTKMLATLFAIATAASFGFSAAAEDASGASSFLASGPGASAADPFTTARGLTSAPISMVQSAETFTTLERVQAVSISKAEMDVVRGSANFRFLRWGLIYEGMRLNGPDLNGLHADFLQGFNFNAVTLQSDDCECEAE